MDAKTDPTIATLTLGNKSLDFPVLSGTIGPDVIDISKLDRPQRHKLNRLVRDIYSKHLEGK